MAAGRKHDEAALASFGYAPGIAPERRERLHAALARAGARLVKEGHARNAAHIDLVLIRDHGFPRHEGGPMHWAEGHGLRRIAATVERLRSGAQLHHILLQPGDGSRIAWLHSRGEVIDQQMDGETMQVAVRLSPDNWARFQAL